MKIYDKKFDDILNEPSLNSKFDSISHDNLKLNCNILNGNFYLETNNFFPITKENNTFLDLFNWKNKKEYEHFYSSQFYENFNKKINSFKSFSDLFILGSSPFDNYYRNMITFIPRIFFNKKKDIKLAIHRNSSNKLRNFIKSICDQMEVTFKLVYLDDGFFKFDNSTIPQFLQNSDSLKILNSMKINKDSKKEKIFISRQNNSVRNLINEDDIRIKLKKLGFRIIDSNDFDIFQQIEIFSNAEVIIGVTGSALTNIAFCNPGTKLIEIQPFYDFKYEDIFKYRYKYIAQNLDLKYQSIIADPINTEITDKNILNNILPSVLNQSNYYKDLLLKLEKLEDIV